MMTGLGQKAALQYLGPTARRSLDERPPRVRTRLGATVSPRNSMRPGRIGRTGGYWCGRTTKIPTGGCRWPEEHGGALLNLAIFLVGCALLFYGAHWLVGGAAKIADTLGIPKSVVGLTLVALGTSAPEMFVNFLAAAKGHTDLALTNVAGSNLANICVGFGLCAMLGTVVVRRGQFAFDLKLLVATPALVLVLFFIGPKSELPYLSVLPLTGVLAVYLISLHQRTGISEVDEPVPGNAWAGAGLLVLGGVCLYGGGELMLRAAVDVAQRLGVSHDIVGLTIVAAGTSVPDIAASVIAARRGEHAIAVGNLVGSNISNVLVVLNGTIVVSGGGLAVTREIRWDYAAAFLVSTVFCVIGLRKETLPKSIAIGFVAGYLGYMALRVALVLIPNGAAG
jgi:cation:H+ antiporter